MRQGSGFRVRHGVWRLVEEEEMGRRGEGGGEGGGEGEGEGQRPETERKEREASLKDGSFGWDYVLYPSSFSQLRSVQTPKAEIHRIEISHPSAVCPIIFEIRPGEINNERR